MTQHPIFPFFVGLFILIMVINDSLMNEKLQRNRFVFAFLNVAFLVVIAFMYTHVIQDTSYEVYYFIYAVLVYIVFILMAIVSFKNSVLKSNHYQLFIKSIRNTRWNAYYVVDQKDRIKDMSDSILEELGLTKEDVIGKKLFDVFDRSIRFTKLNDTEVNNRSLFEFYRDYRLTAKPSQQERRELYFQNYKGKEVILHLIEQPVFIFGKYKGRINMGEKRTDFNMMHVEKELSDKNKELESIRHKFIATLEMTEEGLFYIDLDQKYVWGADQFIGFIKMKSNTIAIEDYRANIHPEDIKTYLNNLQSLTVNNPKYSVSYRYRVGDNYIWLKESGKRIFDDRNANVILGYVKKIQTNHYERSSIPELDDIKGELDMMVSLKKLQDQRKFFQLAIIRLSNIPEINARHGRAVGNMMLGEYVRKLRSSFMSENSEIFRISGLEFAITITDPRKIDVLRKSLVNDDRIMNLKMAYGAIKEEVVVHMGIATAPEDTNNSDDLVICAIKALKMATNPNFKHNNCYYKDLA